MSADFARLAPLAGRPRFTGVNRGMFAVERHEAERTDAGRPMLLLPQEVYQ